MPWGRIDGMASSRRMSRIRYPTTRWRRQQNHLQLSAVPMTIVGTEPRKRPYLYTSTGRCRRRDISLLRVGNTVHEVHYRQGMMNCDKPALPQRIVQDPIYNAMCFGTRPMSDERFRGILHRSLALYQKAMLPFLIQVEVAKVSENKILSQRGMT